MQKIKTAPIRLILDTDMLTDCDDAAALGMLHVMADAGEVEILATGVSSRHPLSAPVVEVINNYYGRTNLAVGAPKQGSGAYRPDSSFLIQVAAEFPHQFLSNDDAPDAVDVYRRCLAHAGAPVKIVTIGYMANLARLLQSLPDDASPLNGSELIANTVSEWVCMGGNFPVDDARDNVNFTRDPASAIYAIRHWPGRITFVGREIGHNIYVGDRLKETPLTNPVRRAYQLHRERYQLGHWNHHTADPSAVLYAVRGLQQYFELQEGGFMDIQDDCSFTWTQAAGQQQAYLLQKMERAAMGQVMERLMIHPPARFSPI